MSGAAIEFANLAAVPESETLAMSARAAALRGSDTPVVSLTAGEPDLPTPEYVREAGVRAIRSGATKYPPAAGLAALREAVAEDQRARRGAAWDASSIVVSVGAKQGLFATLFTLFGPGDRIAVPAPYWVSYAAMVRLARAEPVIVETTAEAGWKMTPGALAEALDAGARAALLNSPSNPTGAVYSGAELDALVDVAAARGAWLVADEIYDEIVYGAEGPAGFASLAPRAAEYDRIVVVNGFSKAYAMTGWRVGWVAAPPAVAAGIVRLQGHLVTNTATASQHAALAALREAGPRAEWLAAMRGAFAARRALLLERLAAVPGLAVHEPDGAFYLWIDASAWCRALGAGSSALCLDLLDAEHVALVPGAAFGGEGHVRLSFAAAEPELEEAVVRLHRAAERLGVAG